MPERTSFTDGEPCWADVMARNPEAARDFYHKVFGWTYQVHGPEHGGYVLCLREDKPVAGVMPWQPSMGEIPAAWSLYLSTSDVNGTAKAFVDAGGQLVMDPMDIPSNGRMAFGSDPTGAMVGLWQAGEHAGFGRVGEPGSFAWAELVTREPAGADRFYGGLFDYQQRQIGGGDFDYTVWSLDGNEACGRLLIQPEMGDMPAQWVIYFAVEDADAAIAQVTDAGGSLTRPPHDSSYGRLAGVSDPEGAAFCLIDLSRRAR